MKKSIIFACAVLFAAAAAFGCRMYRNANAMDELFYANVEALAGDEENDYTCYQVLTSHPSRRVKYCGTCRDEPGRGRNKSVCY